MTERHTLPPRRLTETFELVHADKRYTISVGFFPGRRAVAEVFVSGTKVGSDVEGVARDGAVILSIAMQYNVPLSVIAGAITRTQDGRPMTIVGAVVDRLVKESLAPDLPA